MQTPERNPFGEHNDRNPFLDSSDDDRTPKQEHEIPENMDEEMIDDEFMKMNLNKVVNPVATEHIYLDDKVVLKDCASVSQSIFGQFLELKSKNEYSK